jgi:hypothetical protein
MTKSSILSAFLVAGLFSAPVLAQQTQQPAQPTPAPQAAPTPAPADGTRVATEDFKSWIGMKLETVDGERVGEVVEVIPATGTELEAIHADIGGFLGFGETRVKLMPAQVTKQGDRIVVSLTKEEVKKLPKIES